MCLQIADIPLSMPKSSTSSTVPQVEVISHDYLTRMAQSGTWGDGAILAMACRRYNRIVQVITTDGRITSFATEQQSLNAAENTSMCLGYVKSMGSATEDHYVYLQKKQQSERIMPCFSGNY